MVTIVFLCQQGEDRFLVGNKSGLEFRTEKKKQQRTSELFVPKQEDCRNRISLPNSEPVGSQLGRILFFW